MATVGSSQAYTDTGLELILVTLLLGLMLLATKLFVQLIPSSVQLLQQQVLLNTLPATLAVTLRTAY